MKSETSALNAISRSWHRRRVVAAILVAGLFVGIGLTGCGTSSDSSKKPSSQTGRQAPVANKPPPPPPPTVSGDSAATSSLMEPMLAAWQQDDHPLALRRFTEANWNARPLFAPGSLLGLSESQFTAFSPADRTAKLNDMLKQVGILQQLVRAVLQAGTEAAEKKDSVEARKYFTSLKQCGSALDEGDTLAIVKQVGQMAKKRADAELAKLGP
jgi:hypothetical protein